MRKTVLVLSVVLATQMFAGDANKTENQIKLPGASFDISEEDIKNFHKKCDKGDGKMCSNLGARYLMGADVKKDKKKAEELFKKACDLGFAIGCKNLGFVQYMNKEYKKAIPTLRQWCAKDDLPACATLGFMYYKGLGFKKDIKKAKKFYKKSCDGGYPKGCSHYEIITKAK